MSIRKRNSIFVIFLLSILTSVCYVSITPIKKNIEVNEEQNDLSENILSTPKTSAGGSKLWNFTSNLYALDVAISADGNYMAVGTEFAGSIPGKIYYFNTSNHGGIPMWSYDVGMYNVENIKISANGSYVIAGCSNDDLPSNGGRAILLNSTKPTSGPKIEVWNVTADVVHVVDISADGKYIAVGMDIAGGGVCLVCVFNNTYNSTGGRDKMQEYQWYEEVSHPVTSVAISDDGNYVVAGTDFVQAEADNVIYFFNNSFKSYKEKNHAFNWTYYYEPDPIGGYSIDSIAISGKGEYVVAGSEDAHRAWLFNKTKTTPKEEVWYFDLSSMGATLEFKSADISKDGNLVALGAYFESSEPTELMLYDGALVLIDNKYNTSNGHDKSNDIYWFYLTNGSVNSVSISDDGTYLAAGTEYTIDAGDDGSLDENNVLLFKNPGKISSIDNPGINTPIFTYNTKNNGTQVSISGSGLYFAAAGQYSSGMTYLFYYDTTTLGLLPSGDDDDDDDGGKPGAIPFGSYYLLFTLVIVVSLVLIYKRKAILSKN